MNDDKPPRRNPPQTMGFLSRRAHDHHEETKISSLYILCSNFVEGFLDEPFNSFGGRISAFFSINVWGFGNPKRNDADYIADESVPVEFDYEPKIYAVEEAQKEQMRREQRAGTWAVLKKADDLSRLLLGKGEVPHALILKLLSSSSTVHLVEMADYAEMCERYGLKHFQKILSAATELRPGLDPENPHALHSFVSIAIDSRVKQLAADQDGPNKG